MAGFHAQLPRCPKHVRQAGRRQSRGHGSVAGADAFAAPLLVQEAGSRTASTTLTIASITSCGCSLWISWPLFVFVMCLALETGLASFSCAVRRDICRKHPVSAISAGTCGPHGRSADSTTNGIGFSGGAARISSKLRSEVDPLQVRVEAKTFAYVAFHQDTLHRPLVGRFRLLKPFVESVDEDKAGHSLWVEARI